MEQEFGKNSIDIEALREFCEREGKMVEYRKGEQLVKKRFSQDKKSMDLRCLHVRLRLLVVGIGDALHAVLVHKEIVYLCHIALCFIRLYC